MPQCQRSPNHTRLDSLKPREGVWTCPGHPFSPSCPGGETYGIVGGTDLELATSVIEATEAEFGKHSPRNAILLFWGERPQTIEFEDGISEIYLERAARGQPRVEWQLSHEAFHHVCTPRLLMHWVHEMVALLWSSFYLRERGLSRVAVASQLLELQQAPACPFTEMVRVETVPYPPGFYGQALATGLALVNAVGWKEVTRLANFFDERGSPDVEAWRSSLTDPASTRVAPILAGELGSHSVLIA
jgi:hypothetical protein